MSDLIDQLRLTRRLPAPAVARAIRKSAGIPATAVAHELGVNRVTVHRWESGERRPQGERLRRYVALLDDIRAEVDR